MPPREMFLSYSSQDEEMARRLADTLNAHGVPVFFSPRDIQGAAQWQDVLGEALARCDWFGLLLSPAAASSMWVKRETKHALIQPRFDGRIIPLLYQPCDFTALSWVLPQLQFVDVSGDFDDACRELLKIWGIGYRGQTS